MLPKVSTDFGEGEKYGSHNLKRTQIMIHGDLGLMNDIGDLIF